MLTSVPKLTDILNADLIGFITAVNAEGQPQTSPVWFVLDGEDIIIYNRPSTPRFDSIVANPRISFTLRADRRAEALVTIEGTASKDANLAPAKDFPGYLDKYASEIERLGWTPETFSADYATGLRVVVTRVRTWGLEVLTS